MGKGSEDCTTLHIWQDQFLLETTKEKVYSTAMALEILTFPICVSSPVTWALSTRLSEGRVDHKQTPSRHKVCSMCSPAASHWRLDSQACSQIGESFLPPGNHKNTRRKLIIDYYLTQNNFSVKPPYLGPTRIPGENLWLIIIWRKIIFQSNSTKPGNHHKKNTRRQLIIDYCWQSAQN